jgi:hypothetical protein
VKVYIDSGADSSWLPNKKVKRSPFKSKRSWELLYYLSLTSLEQKLKHLHQGSFSIGAYNRSFYQFAIAKQQKEEAFHGLGFIFYPWSEKRAV